MTVETVALRKSTVDFLTGRDQREIGDKVRGAARMRWFGCVQRRDIEHITRRVLMFELAGSRLRGRAKKNNQ